MFTDSIRNFNCCFLLIKLSWEIEWQTKCKDGLYKMRFDSSVHRNIGSSFEMNSTMSGPYRSISLQKHCKAEYLSTERYMQVSKVLPSVRKFDRETLYELKRHSLFARKGKRFHVPISDLNTTRPLSLGHLDVSGPVGIRICS